MKNELIVFTGLSGSGKSTLAMETLQRECQRQYMESMGLMMNAGGKPKVQSIEGLSPAISISQQSTNRNPRSTVGTITELAPYLRVVFAKLGERPCPHCGKSVTELSASHFSFNKPQGACPTCRGDWNGQYAQP